MQSHHVRWIVALLFTLVGVALRSPPASAAPGLPAGVRVIDRGATLTGTVSPDGTMLAYLDARGRVALFDLRRRGVLARIWIPEPGTCSDLVWSKSGRRLATTQAGADLAVIDVRSRRRTRIARHVRYSGFGQPCGFGFDDAERLIYVDSTGPDTLVLRRAGVAAPIAQLPTSIPSQPLAGERTGSVRQNNLTWALHPPASTHGAGAAVSSYAFGWELGRTRIAAVWSVDVSSGQARELTPLLPRRLGAVGEPQVAPGGRLCLPGEGRLACIQGNSEGLSECVTGASAITPFSRSISIFSPNGKYAVATGRRDRGELVTVCDVERGTADPVAVVDPGFRTYALADDHRIIVTSGGRQQHPVQLMRIDRETRRAEVLLDDTTEYAMPAFVPGKPGLVAIGRERDATRDLALADLRAGHDAPAAVVTMLPVASSDGNDAASPGGVIPTHDPHGAPALPIAGRVCRTASDCGAGEQCAGGDGCDAIWRCVSGQRCTKNRAAWCGCDGKTVITSDGCARAPYAYRGICKP